MEKSIKKYGLSAAILKFKSRLATKMLRTYLTTSAFEWSLIENEPYKKWAHETFNPKSN